MDLGRTTQFLESHTAGGGFESIQPTIFQQQAVLYFKIISGSPTCRYPDLCEKNSIPRCPDFVSTEELE